MYTYTLPILPGQARKCVCEQQAAQQRNAPAAPTDSVAAAMTCINTRYLVCNMTSCTPAVIMAVTRCKTQATRERVYTRTCTWDTYHSIMYPRYYIRDQTKFCGGCACLALVACCWLKASTCPLRICIGTSPPAPETNPTSLSTSETI